MKPRTLNNSEKVAEMMMRDTTRRYSKHDIIDYLTSHVVVNKRQKSTYNHSYKIFKKNLHRIMDGTEKVLDRDYGKALIKIREPKKDGDGSINIIKEYKVRVLGEDDHLVNDDIEFRYSMVQSKQNKVTEAAKKLNSSFLPFMIEVMKKLKGKDDELEEE